MNQTITRNFYLHRQSHRSNVQKKLSTDISDVLAVWLQPGQANLLGASALMGIVKDAEAHARRVYYAHSFGICATVLSVLIAVGYVGHISG